MAVLTRAITLPQVYIDGIRAYHTIHNRPKTTNERYRQADHTCVYPRRYGPAAVSPSKNMRLRYFLRHPDQMKGRHEFMQVLTARTDLGIEFVEGWQLTRIAIAVLIPVIASLVLAVLYSVFTQDVSSAFTVAGECLCDFDIEEARC